MIRYKEDSDSTAVAERLSVDELVALYEKGEAEIRAAFARVAGAVKDISGAFGGVTLRDRHRRYSDVDFDDPGPTIRELRRDVWEGLIERSEVRKAMSIKAWDDLQKKITSQEPPEITAANVQGMLDQFRADIPDMLKAAVDEVFEWMRPHSWHNQVYKTNSEYEIGERVVLEGCVSLAWNGGGMRVSDYREQYLIALENVFAMVDGKVRQETDGYYSRLSTAIKESGYPCHGATDLFEFRAFKKGTLHLKMLRMDLVKKLNAVAGGARLKPPQEDAA